MRARKQPLPAATPVFLRTWRTVIFLHHLPTSAAAARKTSYGPAQRPTGTEVWMGSGPAAGLTAPMEGGVWCGGSGDGRGARSADEKPSCREAQQLQSEPRAGGERTPRAAGWDAKGEFTFSLDPISSETSNRTSRSREPKPTERRTATAAAAPAGDDGKESALLALPLPLPTASSDSVLRSGTNSELPQIQPLS